MPPPSLLGCGKRRKLPAKPSRLAVFTARRYLKAVYAMALRQSCLSKVSVTVLSKRLIIASRKQYRTIAQGIVLRSTLRVDLIKWVSYVRRA